jgi:hypothetical protein
MDGLKATPEPLDPAVINEFVYGKAKATTQTQTPVIDRVPISTRMRGDLAKALKKASLERQLQGVEPNTLQDILEEAVQPWLKSNGYIT